MNMTDIKHLFMLTTIHNFKLHSLSLQIETGMFISEFEKEGSLWNVMSEIFKNRDA